MSQKRQNTRKEDDLATKLLRAAVFMRWISIVLFSIGGAISLMSLDHGRGEAEDTARPFWVILLITLMSVAVLYLCSFLLVKVAKRLGQNASPAEK